MVHTDLGMTIVSNGPYIINQRADQNGDGLLTADEYYSILVDHGVECSREEIRDIIRMADQDHDG